MSEIVNGSSDGGCQSSASSSHDPHHRNHSHYHCHYCPQWTLLLEWVAIKWGESGTRTSVRIRMGDPG